MITKKHVAALAVVTATALVPTIAAQAAEASVPRDPRIAPLELCHPKWVLPPTTGMGEQPRADSNPGDRDDPADLNHTGTGPAGHETVEHDDLTYDGC